jgi:hypothetical protein
MTEYSTWDFKIIGHAVMEGPWGKFRRNTSRHMAVSEGNTTEEQ